MVNENLQAVRKLLKYWDKKSLEHSIVLMKERSKGTREDCE